MSEVLVFRASRVRALWLLIGSTAFVALGAWLASQHPVIGWLRVAFFFLGIPISVAMLARPEVFYLRLDPDGFEMGSPIKSVRTSWKEVDGFDMGSIQGTKMIEIRYNSSYSRAPVMRRVSGALSGMEGAIPNNYDSPLSTILMALREWHARYGAAV